MRQGNYGIEVFVHGHRVTEYPHDGETFIEGRTGQEYKLRLINRAPQRALFVVSIDGLSIMDGQSATRQQGQGYVVGANEIADIPGWRINNRRVGHFLFSALDQSYAHLMGQPKNIGVIGCAVFEEKPSALYLRVEPSRPRPEPWPEPWPFPWPFPWPHRRRFGPEPRIRDGRIGAMADREAEQVFGAAGEPATEEIAQTIGTGFGRAVDHHVFPVQFNRQDHPACAMAIRYMERKELARLGIELKRRLVVATVDPFPGDSTITGCRPPDGWRGS